ncbi:MAG: transglycosylase SLT domain-containing protein [Bacteroidetes bacterium]|nr:transglycosylase SLT domain-containing protein [Bacteroidota bacterium]
MVYDFLVTENKDEFLAQVNDICARLGISPDWLMVVMKMESDIDETASNPYTNATGLIQFMPSTAAGLGTSVEQLKTMSNVQQLDYVYKYFKPYTGRLKSLTDLYMVTFFPRGLGQPDDYVMQTDTISAQRIAQQNPGFDLDKNGQITAGEFRAAILRRVPGDVQITLEEAADYLKKK